MPHDVHRTHWQHWHEQYAEPENPLNRRLSLIRSHIGRWWDEQPGASRRVLSACAGDGRDLLGVLEHRLDDPGVRRLHAVLVELDPVLARSAARHAADLGLEGVEVRTADAGRAANYVGAVPADLVLLCGVFGNIDDDAVRRTVAAVPQLATTGATVIWTRSRRAPDLTPRLRSWFAEVGCEEVAFHAPAGELFSVGVQRFTGETRPLRTDATWFRFTAA